MARYTYQQIDELRESMTALHDLPSLPAIAQQILALSMDPDTTFKQLREQILADPPLAALVMKTANSAFYGRQQPARSIEDAIFTIGLQDLRLICTSISVIKSFSHWEKLHFDHGILWQHSLSCA